MLIPSDILRSKMQSTRAGLWFERVNENKEVQIAAKLPSDLIKAIFRGAKTSIIVSVVGVEQSYVRCVGIRTYDNPDRPITHFRTHSDSDEHLLLETVFLAESIRIHFFDELLRPVMSSFCSFCQPTVEQTLKDLSRTKPHYIGGSGQLTEKALDIFQSDLDAKDKESMVWHEISLSITAHELYQIHAITSHEAKLGLAVDVDEFIINTEDEGAGLEQSAHQLLEYLYTLNLYRSPQVKEANFTRELTDLMAFSSEGICLVEAKVLAVITTQMNRSSDRRSRGIEKQIKKALHQLGGAVRRLRANEEILTRRGQRVQVNCDDETLIQAIVLISSMDQLLDWHKIAQDIITASSENKALFHVLDLVELQRLVAYSQTTDVFHFNLYNRWEKVIETKSALIIGSLPPKA
jgi:hypothetical protein